MTRKERLLTTFRGGKADHVPACPDISVMVPARLTKRPFYELFLDGREHNGWTSATYSEAYVDAVKYFGIDGWYIYGGLKEQPCARRARVHRDGREPARGQACFANMQDAAGRADGEGNVLC